MRASYEVNELFRYDHFKPFIMKSANLIQRYVLSGLGTCLCLLMVLAAQAQQYLQPDQNPRYMESMNVYLGKEDSLTRNEGTTVQQTYKAYQYYEAKREQKEQRRQWRQERRLAGNSLYWANYSYPNYATGYSYPYRYGYGYTGYDHCNSYNYGFRWNDVATVTALALGAYILFR